MAVLAGGVGGARMALALRHVLEPGRLSVIVNVGDDTKRYGVHVSADPDTVLYTLAGIEGPHGWGRADDTVNTMEELARIGVDTSFTLGDKDLALCLHRTQRLDAGEPLSSITADLAGRLGTGDVDLLPATDDELRTFVEIEGGEWLAFQEYFVERHHADNVTSIAYHGSPRAEPAPGVVDAIANADTVVIAPSNPPLSIWPILSIDAIDAAVRAHPNAVAVSPLFGGSPLKGPADAVMAGIGLSPGTRGILQAYRGLVHTLYIDQADQADTSLSTEFDVNVRATDTKLTGPHLGRTLTAAILGGAEGHGAR